MVVLVNGFLRSDFIEIVFFLKVCKLLGKERFILIGYGFFERNLNCWFIWFLLIFKVVKFWKGILIILGNFLIVLFFDLYVDIGFILLIFSIFLRCKINCLILCIFLVINFLWLFKVVLKFVFNLWILDFSFFVSWFIILC